MSHLATQSATVVAEGKLKGVLTQANIPGVPDVWALGGSVERPCGY